MGMTEERLLGSLAGHLMDVALCYVEELNLSARRTRRRVREWFEKTIIGTYRDVIQIALSESHADHLEICLKLEKDKSVLSRWRRGRVKPQWDTLCLAVAAFDVELGDRFPRGRDTVIGAIAQTLRYIKGDLLGEPTGALERSELAYLHYASLSPQWWAAQKTRNQRDLTAVAERLGRKVASEIPGKATCDYREIERIIAAWGKEWFLFHEVIPYRWEYYPRSRK